MHEQLKVFIDRLKTDRRIDSFDEAATKQAVVLRLLSLLGWDTFNIDEVTPEYAIAGGRVDYSLKINNMNKVFIEVKRIGVELENHQEQLLNYAFQQGVKLAVLTNGITWWFYLPLNEGSWEQRKFYTIDILQQESDDIAAKFIDFLSNDTINIGKAIQNAEAIYKDQQKIKRLQEALPKAWNKLIEEADDLLIDLISKTAENICGLKADTYMIEHFLSMHKNNLILTKPTTELNKRERSKVVVSSNVSVTTSQVTGNYTGKSISAFYFVGSQYEARSFKDMLIKLSEILSVKNKNEFERILSISGRKRPYFSKNDKEMFAPQKINNTPIYAETNLSANRIVKICLKILAVFGYSDTDLKIETY